MFYLLFFLVVLFVVVVVFIDVIDVIDVIDARRYISWSEKKKIQEQRIARVPGCLQLAMYAMHAMHAMHAVYAMHESVFVNFRRKM